MGFVLNSVPINTNSTSAGTKLLTKRNYYGNSLLQVIGEGTMGPRTARASASESSAKNSTLNDDVKQTVPCIAQSEVDIDALPLSSDEEEEKISIASMNSPPSRKMPRIPKVSPKRSSPTLTNTVRKEELLAVPDLFDLLPSSQPNKKRKLGYGASTRNIHTAQDQGEGKSKSIAGFAVPADLPDTEEAVSLSIFKAPAPVSTSTRTSAKTKANDAPRFKAPVAQPLEEPVITGPAFRMPAMLEDPDSSAPSITDPIFDVPEPSQEAQKRRSVSTSSLSSHSSIDLHLSLAEQQALAHDDTGDGLDHVPSERCDICHSRVERSLFKELTAKYKGTGIRRRQKICVAHQQHRAQERWTEKGYPIIDWQGLEAERIPKHIPHLTKILRRKAPSVYRTKLDSVAHDENASRKALNDYLREGIIYVAKQGYYGPRGARIMGHAITTTMEKQIEKQLQLDKVVRAAGFGGYVSAVLVPELMVELVKEDMHLKDSDEARQILEQSTTDGALLNGDDDEVVLRTDKDDL